MIDETVEEIEQMQTHSSSVVAIKAAEALRALTDREFPALEEFERSLERNSNALKRANPSHATLQNTQRDIVENVTDGDPGTVTEAQEILETAIDRVIDTCDELVFVTTPEIPSVTDTYKLAQEAEERGKTVLGAVVNMYSGPKNHLSVAEVEESLEMPVLGVVDRSATVQQSIFDTQPVVSMAPYAKPSQEFKQIAADLVGTSYEPSLVDRVRRFLP